MNSFFRFSQELTKRDFIQFLEEKQIHPSDLISLSIKIKNGYLNEANGSRSGFLSALGGALRGMYHGFRSGWGSRNLNAAANTLKKQLELAYEKFLDSLISITGDQMKATQLVTKLRKNAEQEIDNKVLIGEEPAVEPKNRKTRMLPEPEEREEEEQPAKKEPEPETEPKPEPAEEDESMTGVPPAEEDTGIPEEGENEDEEETDEEEEDEFEPTPPITPEEIEDGSLPERFDALIKAGTTSEIHQKISTEYPARNTSSIDALIECLNNNEINEGYLSEGFGIINQVYEDFLAIKKKLAESFIKYVKSNISENNGRKLFKEAESGKEVKKNLEGKIATLKTKVAKYFYIDKDKIENDDELATVVAQDPVLFLSEFDGRNVRHLKTISKKQNLSDPSGRNIAIKVVVDDIGNYILFTIEDLRNMAGIK